MPKKLTIEEMHALAKKRGGKCLSKVYQDANTHLRWQCAEGHKWHAVPSSVKAGTWCPTCGIQKRADRQRGGLEPLQALAEERGGKCLSKVYKNTKTKLEWQCAAGHKWHAVPSSVKAGTWCPTCARKKPSTKKMS